MEEEQMDEQRRMGRRSRMSREYGDWKMRQFFLGRKGIRSGP